MAFVLYAYRCRRRDAQRVWDRAREYLNHSGLARDLFSAIDAHTDELSVVISPTILNCYIWPMWLYTSAEWRPNVRIPIRPPRFSHAGRNSAGLIFWCPNERLRFYVEQPKFLLGLIRVGSRRVVDQISSKLALLHEMGHCWQYLSETGDYVKMKLDQPGTQRRLGRRPLEDTNVPTFENTVAKELVAAGRREGVRIHYGDEIRNPHPSGQSDLELSRHRKKVRDAFDYWFRYDRVVFQHPKAPGGIGVRQV